MFVYNITVDYTITVMTSLRLHMTSALRRMRRVPTIGQLEHTVSCVMGDHVQQVPRTEHLVFS